MCVWSTFDLGNIKTCDLRLDPAGVNGQSVLAALWNWAVKPRVPG